MRLFKPLLLELIGQPVLFYLPILLVIIGVLLKTLIETKTNWEKLYLSYDITFAGMTSTLIYFSKIVDEASKVAPEQKASELAKLIASVSHLGILFISMLGFLVMELLTEKSFRLKEEAYKDKARVKPRMYDIGKIILFGFVYNAVALFLLIKLEEIIGV